MYNRWRTVAAAAAISWLFAPPISAFAAPVHSNSDIEIYLKQNTFPGGLSESKIFLDAANGVTTFTGHVGSQSGTPLTQFVTDSAVDGDNSANGFAQIGKGNDSFTSLTFTMLGGFVFGDLLFDTHGADELTISAWDGVTKLIEHTFDGLGGGEQSWLILALKDVVMDKVIITAEGDNEFKDMKHFQVSEVEERGGGPNPVPLPAAAYLLGTALVGLGLLGRRRRAVR